MSTQSNTLFDTGTAPQRDVADRPEWQGQAVVYGPAQTQGSKKGFVHPHLKRVVIVDDNDRALKSWRQEFIQEMQKCRPGRPLDQAVALSIVVYTRRPMSHYGSGKNAGVLKDSAPVIPPSGKDIDKVARAILDAGQIAGWYVNDARVADLRIRRRYDEGTERVWVWAWTLTSLTQGEPELDESSADEEKEPY